MAQSLKSVNVITLFVEDQLRSKAFYEQIFDVVGVDEGHGTVIFQFDNLFLRLLRREEAESEMLGQVPVGDARAGTTVQLAFRIEDADTLCRELAERGISIVYGPVNRPWGVRSAAFVDPDGHVWQFSSDIPQQ
jgi:catechol 2,3-dioxygenase-like lactoylglutathione lyase family enzyme